MQRRHLASLAAALAVLLLCSATQAADKGWFGIVIQAEASDAKPPVVKSITVQKVLAGSPAAHAGIAAGDSLVEIQGVVVAGGSADALLAALKRSVGETLRLKVRHGGDVHEVSLVAVAAPAP